MIMETLLQGTAAAASAGLGCGTCCSPGITAFLSGYTMTHSENRKQSLVPFVCFYCGKILAVMVICMAASFAGKEILKADGTIGNWDMEFFVNLFMAVTAICFIVRWLAEKQGKTKKCNHCHSCTSKKEYKKRTGYVALFGLGAGYGVTPCAPLLFMAGYSAAIPIGNAAVSGCIFALASSVSTMLMLCFLSGLLTEPLQKEIPQYLPWIRLVCYVLLLVFSVLGMV